MHFIVPFRGLETSKTRIKSNLVKNHLSPSKLNAIVWSLFIKTIKTLRELNIDFTILTADRELLQKLPFKANVVHDSGKSLNKAINDFLLKNNNQSSSRFLQENMSRLGLIMPDLPKFNSDNFNKILKLSTKFEFILVPTHDSGTAIAILPVKIWKLGLLGINSANKIINQMENESYRLYLMIIQELYRDLDTYEDYEYWSKLINFNKEVESTNKR
jgi:2-phospho-L-lactate guanylyltransferase (CobY/MobA/RfbA family)